MVCTIYTQRQGPSLGPCISYKYRSLQNIDNLVPHNSEVDTTRRKVEIYALKNEGTISTERWGALEGATGGRPEAGGPRVGPLRSMFAKVQGSLVSSVGAEGTLGRDGGGTGVLEIEIGQGGGGDFSNTMIASCLYSLSGLWNIVPPSLFSIFVNGLNTCGLISRVLH